MPYRTRTSIIWRMVVPSILAVAFLQYFVEGLLLHRMMTQLDVAGPELMKLKDSGELDVKVAQSITLAIFCVGMIFAIPIISVYSRNRSAVVGMLAYLIISMIAILISHNDEILPQISRSIRYINAFFVLPALAYAAVRKVGMARVVTVASLAFYIGYLFCAISILFDLSGSKAIAQAGFRYSVFLTSATAQATLFAGAIMAVFLFRAVPGYKSIPWLVRIPLEILTCVSALSIIILTGSRGPFLALGAGGVLYSVMQMKRNPALIWGLAVAPLAISGFLLTDESLAKLLEYFGGREGLDISTGRTKIWSHTIAQMRGLADFLFGYSFDTAPHNTFLGIFVLYGFLGLLIFSVFQLQLFKATVTCLRGRAVNGGTRDLLARVFAIQFSIAVYGMYENFFFLNNGLLMLVYYFLFGMGFILNSRSIQQDAENPSVDKRVGTWVPSVINSKI
jgi:O-antigen ligase